MKTRGEAVSEFRNFFCGIIFFVAVVVVFVILVAFLKLGCKGKMQEIDCFQS